MAAGGGSLNHVVAGAVAALALPLMVFVLHLPFLLALPIAGGLYAGVAILLAPRRAIDRVDPARVGRAQAELVAGLIEEGEQAVARLAETARRLRSRAGAATTARLADLARTILARLASDPGKLPAVRRFVTYYLPRSAEIAAGLVVVESQTTPDAARVTALEDTLARLERAFTLSLDNFARTDIEALTWS